MKLNNKLTVYSPPFPRLRSYYDVIDFACENGFTSVEPFCMFEFDTPDTEKAHKVKEYADKKGIVFPCFSVYATIMDTDIEEETEKLKGFAEVASILGSPYLHHTVVGQIKNPEAVVARKKELLTDGINVVREVYDYAQSLGVKTVYEDQGYIFNGVNGFGEFLDKVDRNVGVVADFGNVCQSGDNIYDFVRAFHDKVVHAHIKDVIVTDEEVDGSFPALDGRYVQYVAIGKGELDCKGVIDLLKSYGYDGYYGLEYAVTDDNSPVIDEIIKLVNTWL